MSRAVIYARFSSDSQRDGFSIEAQIHACEEFAKHNNHTIIRKYVDEAKSGTSLSTRTQFKQMMNDAESVDNSFDIIICNDYARFARSKHDHVVYKHKLRYLNISVSFVSQDLDPNDPNTVLIESMFEGMAESYSRKLSRDVVRGMVEGAKRGFYTGGRPPLGYLTEDVMYEGSIKRKLVIDLETEWIIKEIFELYSSGKRGFLSIAQVLNKKQSIRRFCAQSISNILYNSKYNGTMEWGKRKDQRKRFFGTKIPSITVKDVHSKIIDDKLFNKCQKILNYTLPVINSTRKKPMRSTYLLTSVIRCGSCGGAYIGVSAKSGKYHYYECLNTRKYKSCNNKRFPVDRIESKVIVFLKKHIFNKRMIERVVNNIGNDQKTRFKDLEKKKKSLEYTIKKNSKKYDKLMDFITNNDDFDASIMKEKLNTLQIQLKRDNDELSIICEKNKITELGNLDKEYFRDFFESQVQNILSNRIHNETIKSLIRTITLNSDHMEIHYHLSEEIQDLGSKVLILSSSVDRVGQNKNYSGNKTKQNTEKIFKIYNDMAIKRKVMV